MPLVRSSARRLPRAAGADRAGGFGARDGLDPLLLAQRVVRGRARRQVGIVLIALAALVPVGAVASLAASSRGFTGQVSHIWSSLTSTHKGVGDNPGRLVELGNSRPRYWREGIKVGEHALLA